MSVCSSAPNMSTSSLTVGGRLFVFGVRQWVVCAGLRQPIESRVMPFYRRYGIEQALPFLDELLSFITTTASRNIAVQRPCGSHLGDDELLLLRGLQALQNKNLPSTLQLISGILEPPFRRTYTRLAHSYLSVLEQQSLDLTGLRYLYLTTAPRVQ